MNGHSKTNSAEKIFLTSERKPNLFETDRGKELYNRVFQNFLNNKNINFFSRSSSIRDLIKRPVFERGDANWVDVLPKKSKQDKNGILSSTKLTPIQASLKKNDGSVCQNVLDKRRKFKTECKIVDLV